MTINTVQPTGFMKNYNYIGQLLDIGSFSGNIFISHARYEITDIPGTNSILVSVPNNNNGFFIFA